MVVVLPVPLGPSEAEDTALGNREVQAVSTGTFRNCLTRSIALTMSLILSSARWLLPSGIPACPNDGPLRP